MELPQSVLLDLCKHYKHLGTDNVSKIISYNLKRSSDVAAGFLGRHQVLRIRFQRTPVEPQEEVIFFIKSSPSDIASRANYLEQFGVFKKEICVYRDVLTMFQEGIPRFSAKCFYAKDDILVFEHLGEMGFRMQTARSGLLDFDHLNCALKALAALHAGSIILETKSGKTIPEMFPSAVKENAYPLVKDGVRIENFTNANVAFRELIKLMPQYRDSDRLKFILKEFPIVMGAIFELSQPSKKYRNVLNHGDLWANNVLFKYHDGRPVESRLVDFQLSRYAPPVLDVITLLTIPTSREFRYHHLDALLENYYNEMKSLLMENGIQMEQHVSQKDFEDSVGEFMLCGLIESCLFSHLTILPPELTQNLTEKSEGFEEFFNKRSEICIKAFNSDEVYRERMTDMISDIIDNYILI